MNIYLLINFILGLIGVGIHIVIKYSEANKAKDESFSVWEYITHNLKRIGIGIGAYAVCFGLAYFYISNPSITILPELKPLLDIIFTGITFSNGSIGWVIMGFMSDSIVRSFWNVVVQKVESREA